MMSGMSFSEVDYANDWLDEKQSKKPITVESINVKTKQKELGKEVKQRLKDNHVAYAQRSKNIPENRRNEIDKLE